MKNDYRVIPHAADRISRVMATLGIAAVDSNYTPATAMSHKSRYYMTPVRTKKRSVVWFKASLQSDPHLRRALREEIRVQKMFDSYERRVRPRFDSPSYIAHHDDHRGFLWLIRKYWDGIFAGDMVDQFGFAPVFFRAVSPRMMADILNDVRRMTSFARSRGPLEAHDCGWYMLDYNYYRREFFSPMLRLHPAPGWDRNMVDRLAELYLQNQRHLHAQAVHFTHGDLYPTNIMIRPSARRPVVIFDWELAHLNLSTFDPAMIYLHAWRRPAWQKEFHKLIIRSLHDTPATRLSWRITIASLTTRLAGFCFIRLHNLQPDRYPRLPRDQRGTLNRLYRYHLGLLHQVLLKP